MNATTKQCSKCLEYLSLSFFYKEKRAPLGLRSECKACGKEAERRYYSEPGPIGDARRERRTNRDSVRDRAKWTEMPKEQRKRLSEKKRQNPHTLVRETLKRHLRKGLVVKLPCEVCGNTKVDGHHDDYSKPLEVRWLCKVHHLEAHGRKQRITL